MRQMGAMRHVERVRVEPGLTKPGPGAHGLGTTYLNMQYGLFIYNLNLCIIYFIFMAMGHAPVWATYYVGHTSPIHRPWSWR